MSHNSLEDIYNNLRQELKDNPSIRRVRVNPFLYQQLCNVIDREDSHTLYGMDIIEDPSVDTYVIEY